MESESESKGKSKGKSKMVREGAASKWQGEKLTEIRDVRRGERTTDMVDNKSVYA